MRTPIIYTLFLIEDVLWKMYNFNSHTWEKIEFASFEEKKFLTIFQKIILRFFSFGLGVLNQFSNYCVCIRVSGMELCKISLTQCTELENFYFTNSISIFIGKPKNYTLFLTGNILWKLNKFHFHNWEKKNFEFALF